MDFRLFGETNRQTDGLVDREGAHAREAKADKQADRQTDGQAERVRKRSRQTGR